MEQDRRGHVIWNEKILFRALLEISLAGVYLFQDGRIVYVNGAFEEILGWPAEEIYRSDFLDLIHPEDRELVRKMTSHQAGILSVDCIEALLDAAKALEGCPLPQGPNVAILSGQAGPAMAAADVCEDEGLKIVPFAVGTQQNINELLPPLALPTNPVDMGPAWYDASAVKGM